MKLPVRLTFQVGAGLALSSAVEVGCARIATGNNKTANNRKRPDILQSLTPVNRYFAAGPLAAVSRAAPPPERRNARGTLELNFARFSMPPKHNRVVAIYPGSFDPITTGHLDVIERGSRLFDRMIVSILHNESKAPLFTVEERVEMLSESVRPFKNVEVDCFHGLLADYALSRNASVILRGIRAISDYENELQMALMNRRLQPGLETVFLLAGEAFSFISSRLFKEVIGLGGNISGLVPPLVEQRLRERLRPRAAATIRTKIDPMTPTLEATKPLAERISSISVSSTMKVSADADKLRAQGDDVVDFSAGEPDFPRPITSSRPPSARSTQNFTKYTAAGGTAELKQAVWIATSQEFGTSYKASECIITVGGKHVIFNLHPGAGQSRRRSGHPVPYWVTYKDIVNYAGGSASSSTPTSRRVPPDRRHGGAYITPRTRMVIVNSPSNPSGAIMAVRSSKRFSGSPPPAAST